MDDDIIYKHSIALQLRSNDIDRFGHINNAVYFSYYDLGKTNYIETVLPSIDWEKKAIVVVQINVTFISQIFRTDSIAVQTAVTRIGSKSFDLIQRVINLKTGEVKCLCKSTMVAYDLLAKKSIPLSNELVTAICNFEKKDLRTK